jgi:hypothetical protein
MLPTGPRKARPDDRLRNMPGISMFGGATLPHRPGTTGLPHATLVADCTKVFVDTEDDQDEFREDA